MAEDKSIITVPSISYTSSFKIGTTATESVSTAGTGRTGAGSGGTERPSGLNLLGGRPTVGSDALSTTATGARRGPAQVESSGGGSSPSGLGDTLDSGPDNSRLGGSNSGGGTPNF